MNHVPTRLARLPTKIYINVVEKVSALGLMDELTSCIPSLFSVTVWFDVRVGVLRPSAFNDVTEFINRYYYD